MNKAIPWLKKPAVVNLMTFLPVCNVKFRNDGKFRRVFFAKVKTVFLTINVNTLTLSLLFPNIKGDTMQLH